MRRVTEYILIFVAAVLLQVFLFDNLNISPYLYPLFYVIAILLMPVDMKHARLILAGFVLGVAVDLLSGGAGLNTIAATATAFVRPAVLDVLVGKEALHEVGMPLPVGVGRGRWLRYTAVLVLVHCTIYFFFEAASFRYVWYTLLRILGSAVSTILLIFFTASFLPAGKTDGMSVR